MVRSGHDDMETRSSRPLVTIVTATCNRSRLLDATIASVLSQDYPAVEYIVVDDGSTDDTPSVLAYYARSLAAHPLAWGGVPARMLLGRVPRVLLPYAVLAPASRLSFGRARTDARAGSRTFGVLLEPSAGPSCRGAHAVAAPHGQQRHVRTHVR